jgi:acyl-CoA reductase-like NAD-dependent aldehyde dehydrogenase
LYIGAAGSRIYVQSAVYDHFISLFKEQMQQIKVSDLFGRHYVTKERISINKLGGNIILHYG